MADRIGFGNAYRIALFLQAAAVAMLALSGSTLALAAATVIPGIFTPGIVPLALGGIHELVPHDHTEQRAAWSRATTAFAFFQVPVGNGYSFMFSHTHDGYADLHLRRGGARNCFPRGSCCFAYRHDA